MLWFHCELRIETGNKKHKTKCPTNSRFKTKYHVYSLFKRGKGTYVKTLEVCNIKTLEVYNVKTLEVCNIKNTRGVYCLTLEVYTV